MKDLIDLKSNQGILLFLTSFLFGHNPVSFENDYYYHVSWVLLMFHSYLGCELVSHSKYPWWEILPLFGLYHCPPGPGPKGAATPKSAFLFSQVVDVAPELLRICSLILADNKIPPGEGGSSGQGQGSQGLGVGEGQSLRDLSLCTFHPDTKAALLLLLTFLARQHTDSFHSALGSLPGDKAQELQAVLGLT